MCKRKKYWKGKYQATINGISLELKLVRGQSAAP
jgi:hypothetical protein